MANFFKENLSTASTIPQTGRKIQKKTKNKKAQNINFGGIEQNNSTNKPKNMKWKMKKEISISTITTISPIGSSTIKSSTPSAKYALTSNKIEIKRSTSSSHPTKPIIKSSNFSTRRKSMLYTPEIINFPISGFPKSFSYTPSKTLIESSTSANGKP